MMRRIIGAKILHEKPQPQVLIILTKKSKEQKHFDILRLEGGGIAMA